MSRRKSNPVLLVALFLAGGLVVFGRPARGQMIDRTQAPNGANDGISKSLAEQVGTGRGDWTTPDSSSFLIYRDPFRAIRRGRQLFQRKFCGPGQRPAVGDGVGDIDTITRHRRRSLGHLRLLPRPAARLGRLRRRRRDAPRQPRRAAPVRAGSEGDAGRRDHGGAARRSATRAVAEAQRRGRRSPRARRQGHPLRHDHRPPDGTLDTSERRGRRSGPSRPAVLRPRRTISIREFVVGALNAEMGLQAADPDLAAARRAVVTPSGMVLDGALDRIEAAADADPAPTRTATASATRSRRPRRLHGVLSAQLLQAGDL